METNTSTINRNRVSLRIVGEHVFRKRRSSNLVPDSMENVKKDVLELCPRSFDVFLQVL